MHYRLEHHRLNVSLRHFLLGVWLVLALTGCASNKSYVVLMKNADGNLGKVRVSALDGNYTTLDQPQQATFIGSEVNKTFSVPDKQIARDFGAALSATPILPVSFLLYFDTSNTKLTASSIKLIPEITNAINKHPAPDVSIIGHTDTVGDDSYNNKLSMERARAVSKMLDLQTRLEPGRLFIEAHGEKRLLLPTPDNTAESRNRRVEVTIR